MPNPLQDLSRIHRPRLLISAARCGLPEYCRERDLKRILRCARLPEARAIFGRLMDEEAALDSARRNVEATYNLGRHIEVLIALMAEAELASRRMSPEETSA